MKFVAQATVRSSLVSQTAGDLEFIDMSSHNVVDRVVTGKHLRTGSP